MNKNTIIDVSPMARNLFLKSIDRSITGTQNGISNFKCKNNNYVYIHDKSLFSMNNKGKSIGTYHTMMNYLNNVEFSFKKATQSPYFFIVLIYLMVLLKIMIYLLITL